MKKNYISVNYFQNGKDSKVHTPAEIRKKLRRQKKLKSLRGKLHWEGDLDKTRRD